MLLYFIVFLKKRWFSSLAVSTGYLFTLSESHLLSVFVGLAHTYTHMNARVWLAHRLVGFTPESFWLSYVTYSTSVIFFSFLLQEFLRDIVMSISQLQNYWRKTLKRTLLWKKPSFSSPKCLSANQESVFWFCLVFFFFVFWDPYFLKEKKIIYFLLTLQYERFDKFCYQNLQRANFLKCKKFNANLLFCLSNSTY